MTIQEPIDRDKKLNIIAIADESEYGTATVRYGLKLAEIFRASLTIITKFGFTMEEPKGLNLSDSRVHDIEHLLDSTVETSILTEYFFPELLYNYAEKRNTMMFVIGVEKDGKNAFFSTRKAIRFIKPSRLPVMTVGLSCPSDDVFKHVILPLDIERQAKEKALWAGYFSRFHQSTIHLLYPNYRDSGLLRQLTDNIDFVKKLYQNLEVAYDEQDVQIKGNIDYFSIEYAPRLNATLTVMMMTKYVTLGDLLSGSREKKMIGNTQGLPILCINQRDDLYVLCT